MGKDPLDAIDDFLKEHPFHFTIIPNATVLVNDVFQLMWGYPFTIITDEGNRIIGAIRARGADDQSVNVVVSEIDAVLSDAIR